MLSGWINASCIYVGGLIIKSGIRKSEQKLNSYKQLPQKTGRAQKNLIIFFYPQLYILCLFAIIEVCELTLPSHGPGMRSKRCSWLTLNYFATYTSAEDWLPIWVLTLRYWIWGEIGGVLLCFEVSSRSLLPHGCLASYHILWCGPLLTYPEKMCRTWHLALNCSKTIFTIAYNTNSPKSSRGSISHLFILLL